jgi:MFS family permease
MAIFFGISGGLTAIGPIAGGFLTQWTWRSIFWINLPVALIALVLIARAHLPEDRHPGELDLRGAALITGAMGLTVLGLQQSSSWGWSSPATWVCLLAGLALMVLFVRAELRTPRPLLQLRIFADRGFAVENVVLALMSVAFVPFFFFASVYAQVSLAKSSSNAGEYLLYFFIGFVVAAQIGGRVLDRRGARPAVVLGSAIAAVGFYLLAGKLTDLSLGAQTLDIIIAGAGLGLMLGSRAPTRSTELPAAATARSPASPRRRATSERAWGLPSWARFSSAVTRSTSPTRSPRQGCPQQQPSTSPVRSPRPPHPSQVPVPAIPPPPFTRSGWRSPTRRRPSSTAWPR